MKRIYYYLFVIGILFFGSTKISFAGETCFTGKVDCGDGTGSLTLICGETDDEIFEEMIEMVDVICG